MDIEKLDELIELLSLLTFEDIKPEDEGAIMDTLDIVRQIKSGEYYEEDDD